VRARSSLLWPLLAILAEAVVATVDVIAGNSTIFTTAFLLPVLALALLAPARHVTAVAPVGVTLAVLSGFWDDYAFSTDHVVRLTIVAVGVVLAVLSARVREAADRERRRMALLAELARSTDAPTFAGVLERVGAAIVPAVADRVWIDETQDGGDRRRVLDHGTEGRGDPVVIPLTIRDRAMGELGLRGRRYDAGDRAFFVVLAGRIALAVANARLLDELTRTRERLDRILGSLAEAVTVHDAGGQTIYANDAARELLGVEVPEALPATPGSLASRFIITHEDGSPVSVDEFPGRRLVAGETDPPPMLTRSVRRDTGREYWLLTKATLLYDADGAPLAASVIEDVTDAKEADLRRRFLDEAGQVLASSLDYEQALQRVCDLAVPWLADWAAVDLAGEERIERVAIAHSDPSKLPLAAELERRYPPDPDAATGVPAVIRTGRVERYDDIPDELIEQSARDAEHLELIRDIGIRSALVVPMTAGDETLGAMTFVSAESARTFGDDDFAFAQDLARRAATAVQNGRLYAEQVRVAHTLQRSLLPDKLPALPGWQAGASYEAGDARAEVGGDFYDVVGTAGGHVVFLGDVTGKGIEAAALTALVRHSAQMGARFDHRPSALLALVNRVLREQPRLAPVSVVCALIEDRDGAPLVTVASAGHPLPLLKRRGEPPREVGRHDVLLGVVDQDAFTETTVELAPGDALLFFTDGVLDAPGADGRFGEQRLLDAVAGAPADPAALLQAVEAALRAFASGDRADDRAMLALRYIGAPASAAAAAPMTSAPA
jgi:PAS domain S-box-containing protein